MRNLTVKLSGILFLILVLCNSIEAQMPAIPKVKLPNGSNVTQAIKNKISENLAASRKEYDESSFNYAVSLSDNAGLYENEEKYAKNQKMLSEVFKNTDGQQNTPIENADSYIEAGEMMYASGKYKSAESSFLKAKKNYEAESQTDTRQYARILANLGLLYHTTARYNDAESFTQQSMDLRLKLIGDTSRIYAASVNNMAVLYKDMGRYNEAEVLIAKAILINKNSVGPKSVPYALTLNNQAMLFHEIGRNTEAEKLMQEALTVANEGLKEKSSNYVRLMINLGQLYFDMGRFADAETIYLNAIKIKEQRLGTAHPDYAHMLNRLAGLYVVMGKHEKVEELYKKSMGIYEKKFGKEHPSYAETIYGLGEFYRIKGRNQEALTLLTQAMNTRQATLGGDHPDFALSLESVGLTYWQMNNIAEASTYMRKAMKKYTKEIDLYFAPMSEAEKAKFWDKIHPAFERFYAFAVANATADPTLLNDMYNYQLSTKAMLLNSTNKIKSQILSSGDADLIKMYKQWLDEKEMLGRYYSMSKAELADEKVNLDSLEQSANNHEKQLSAKSSIFTSGYEGNKIVWSDVLAPLAADEAAVEIIHVKHFNKVFTDTVYYAALILTKENPNGPTLVLLDNGSLLEKRYLNYYRNMIRNKTKDEKSYGQFWEKIDAKLTGKKTIYVSLDGIYNQINLNTLALPSGAYLIDQKNLVVVTNTKDIIKLKKTKPAITNNTAVLAGFPTYGSKGTIVSLPGTKTELEGIRPQLVAKAYKTTLWLGKDATEANIKSVKGPRILHIATHGFFLTEIDTTAGAKVYGIETTKSKENPLLRSGLMLTGAEDAIEGKTEDGILFAYEVMNMSLENTEVVIVSACETGLGDVKNGEGVYGLQRAFQVAGADAIIMSLWKVNDQATQILMKSFYKNYLALNNKQKAFRAAQIELRATFKEPYYWGAFVLVE